MNPMQYYGTGRRKSAVARVYLRPGNGQFIVNRKPLDEYFPEEVHRALVRQPLIQTQTMGSYNVLVNVSGGGLVGQAGAVRHGLARALERVPDGQHRPVLKKAGLLTRDARTVERKKYGQPGARRRFQYSKR
ncbi:MAG: 30S ribosomal protein S9 [Candidatus Lambdaproteobacteria bacterium]|nr:30S ribosomal protein S9 [Candidatus Lambdaproteobacteria bacterium]